MTSTIHIHGQNKMSENCYIIFKNGRGFYRPESSGYTSSITDSGRYSLADAIDITHPNGPDGPRDGMTYRHENEYSSVKDKQAELARLLVRVDQLNKEIAKLK